MQNNTYFNFPQMQQLMLQQQQQFYNAYLLYCQQNGLNYQDQNVYNQYCLMMMMNMNTNMGNNNMGNNMGNNNFGNNNMGNNMGNNNFGNNNMGNNNNNNNINNNQNVVNNNNQDENPNDIYIPEGVSSEPKPIIPRQEKTIYINQNELQMNNNNFNNFNNFNNNFQMPNQNFTQFAGLDNNIINVVLRTTAGFSVVINAPKTMTFEELFINFANKAGVPYETIGKEIVFLFSAAKIDTKSKLPISSMFKGSNARITIIDLKGIIGA